MVEQKHNGQIESNERYGRIAKDLNVISPEHASNAWDFFSSHPSEWRVDHKG